MPEDPNSEVVAQLWTEYKADGAPEARERLIIHYSPLVKFVAGRVAAGLPQSIEQSDLVSYGIFGLIDADRQVRSRPRLQVRDVRDLAHQGRDHRRAAFDRLGAAVGARQGARDRARVLEARERAEAHARRQGGRGRARHVASRSSTTCCRRCRSSGSSRSTSCSPRVATTAAAVATVGDTIADGAHDPVEAFEVDEMKHLLADAINRMPDRERLVLTLYYYEGLTLGGDRRRARRHREPGVPDPHQGDPAAPRPSRRSSCLNRRPSFKFW